MKGVLLAAALLLGAGASQAADMQAVPRKQAHCAKRSRYCFEWRFVRDPSLRFIAQGQEEGGTWTFYRRDGNGRYRALFEVYPAMLDDRHPEQTFWGFAWDIDDVVVMPGSGEIVLKATFDHAFRNDGTTVPLPGQVAVPFVLFRGHTTQPDLEPAPELRLVPLSIDELERRAHHP